MNNPNDIDDLMYVMRNRLTFLHDILLSMCQELPLISNITLK